MKPHSILSARSLSLVLVCSAPLAAQDMHVPGPEHQKLAKGAGSWDCVVEAMGMDGKPATSKATSETKMLPGGFWLVEEFTGDFMGQPFQGHGVFGYDPAKAKYVGSWVDSMAPSLLVMEGTFDRDGKVQTMIGQGPGMDGKMTTLRMVTTWKDDNTKVFQMFAPGPDGKEACGLTITYTRRAAKAGAAGLPAKK
jgi:hypothetical protein